MLLNLFLFIILLPFSVEYKYIKDLTQNEDLSRRELASLTKINDNLYLIGGINNNKLRSIIYEINTTELFEDENEYKGIIKESHLEIYDHQSIGITYGRYENNIIIIGGKNLVYFYSNIFIYDTELDEIFEVEVSGDNPLPLIGHKIFIRNNSIYLIGGEYENCNEYLYYLNIEDMTWYKEGKTIFGCKSYHSISYHEDRDVLVVSSGLKKENGQYTTNSDIYEYSFTEKKWTLIDYV